MENELEFIISHHAQERYAERIMGKTDKTAIVQFINDHEDKIATDISKMINYGTLLYSGKTFSESKSLMNIGEPIDVYSNGLWVIFVNNKSKVVITLYKINLGAGENIDKEFVESLTKTIREKTAIWDDSKQRGQEAIETIHEDIDAKTAEVAEYKSRIKMLEEIIEAKKEEIVSINHGIELNERAVRDQVLLMVGKRYF